MKPRAQVTPEKLRGGFYTPDALVAACLNRVRERLPDGHLRLLEPSAGDGAFIRALGSQEWQRRVTSVVAVEPLEIEAGKCRYALADSRLQGQVVATSAISWALGHNEPFDAALGNPPFVRYQFISPRDRGAILRLGTKLGIEFAGVSNLWIPVLLAALGSLRRGGAFAFVVPTECLTGCSAAVVRQWLIDECDEICFDLFAPGSFPDVLQEVAILSGRRSMREQKRPLPVRVVEHRNGVPRDWAYAVRDASAWTRYLLDPRHLDALDEANRLPLARRLDELVAFEVSVVSGANDFFCVDEETLSSFELLPWARPLLPRIRHAPGLVLTEADRELARSGGAKVWLLDFAVGAPDPMAFPRAVSYLRAGEAKELHKRYKCRIREPWFRVPGIVRGELLLSKRSHVWPRVVVNQARVFTTDTIYRGRMVTSDRTAGDIAAVFHNSLTLLTAEVEGRSFGGGVLELVPSEIGRLTTLVPEGAASALPRLDEIVRNLNSEELIEATDQFLVASGVLPQELVPLLSDARSFLAARRFERNRRSGSAEAAAAVSVAAA